MEAMAHRNRWFTVLNSVVDLSHGYVTNNQMVNPMFGDSQHNNCLPTFPVDVPLFPWL
jgi:hypothetical protein